MSMVLPVGLMRERRMISPSHVAFQVPEDNLFSLFDNLPMACRGWHVAISDALP